MAPGPKPATLDALGPYLSEAALKSLVDKVCRLNSSSPPMLLERATTVGPGVAVESTSSKAVGKPGNATALKAVPFSVEAIASTKVVPVLGALSNEGVGSLRPAVNCAVASLIM
jgi:hypothetical protein